MRVLLRIVWVGLLCFGSGVGLCAEPAGDEKSSVRVGGIVLKWLRLDKEANYRRAEKLIREAAAGGAKIVVTTESFLDGYTVEDKTLPLELYRSMGEKIPGGEYYEKLRALADELDIYLVAGFPEADGEDRYNAAVMIGPEGKLLGKYRKQHIMLEAMRNKAGTEATVVETEYGNFGLLICADRWSQELAQAAVDEGAEALIYLSGGSYGPSGAHRPVQARSKESKRQCLFIHPVQFLATAADGSILKDELLGALGTHPPEGWSHTEVHCNHSILRGLLIAPEQVGGERDQSGVVYFDLPLPLVH